MVGKPGGKIPLGKLRSAWEDNKVHHKEIGWEGADWIHLAQNGDQLRIFVNAVLKLRVP
jgi:hypothetical protein